MRVGSTAAAVVWTSACTSFQGSSIGVLLELNPHVRRTRRHEARRLRDSLGHARARLCRHRSALHACRNAASSMQCVRRGCSVVTPSVRMVSLPMVGLGRAAGPIFDKEMRVASRRIRYYALRAAYAGALTFLVMVTWSSTMRTGSALVLASRMPEVAKTVTTAITWLQFLAAQGLAVILLSSAIGEEVRKGTLGVLLTTRSRASKSSSASCSVGCCRSSCRWRSACRCWPFCRLLGGVPWDYVLAGACITLTTTLFAGALSLWLSTHSRYGSQAISTSLLLILWSISSR